MKKTILILSMFLISSTVNYGQEIKVENDSKEEVAVKSANSWLKLVTDGNYGESWGKAAKLFKGAVTKEQWEKALGGLLPPFGALISREVISAKYMTSIPGAPDGEYVIISYKTQFEEKENAIETVTPMMDEDGIWRVSGYFIK